MNKTRRSECRLQSDENEDRLHSSISNCRAATYSKKTGPRTEPYRTRHSMTVGDEDAAGVRTYCCRPTRYDSHQFLDIYPVLSWSSSFRFVPLIFQRTACLGSLLSSIRRTFPSHLSLLSFIMRFIFSSCFCTLALSI